MASKQSDANKKHYEILAIQEPPSPEGVIGWNDVHWTALTAEPGGVDYIELDAGGAQALWIVPKGCVENRVILCVHGGGYVSGSIYTHSFQMMAGRAPEVDDAIDRLAEWIRPRLGLPPREVA